MSAEVTERDREIANACYYEGLNSTAAIIAQYRADACAEAVEADRKIQRVRFQRFMREEDPREIHGFTWQIVCIHREFCARTIKRLRRAIRDSEAARAKVEAERDEWRQRFKDEASDHAACADKRIAAESRLREIRAAADRMDVLLTMEGYLYEHPDRAAYRRACEEGDRG